MHGIGIIWHLTIHLPMTPCGLDWLKERETDPQTSNVHAFAYGHESSRQLTKYTLALPVSDMYFQLEPSLHNSWPTREETCAETYRPRWFGGLDGMSYVPPKPGTDRHRGNYIMARDAIWQKKKLVTIIGNPISNRPPLSRFGNPNPRWYMKLSNTDPQPCEADNCLLGVKFHNNVTH